jgi:RNA polymerase sigma factor (sigma-70 family)
VKEFVDVVKRRLGAFHQQALRRLGNAADAEDAVQDALLSAFTHLDQFKGQAQMSTWLTTIVINSARMKLLLRPRQLHILLEHRDEDREQFKFAETLSDHRPNPEQICRKGEFGERLAECSARLSPCLRKTFELRDVEGLSIREAAKVMEVPRGTMKARLARARAGMKEMVRKSLGKKARRGEGVDQAAVRAPRLIRWSDGAMAWTSDDRPGEKSLATGLGPGE